MSEDQSKHVMLALLKDNMREMNMLAAIKFEPNGNEHPSDKVLVGGGETLGSMIDRCHVQTMIKIPADNHYCEHCR